jgi:hypothetical protein
MRRALVGDELVLDAGIGQGPLERLVHLRGDVLVGARLEREDRRFQLGRALGRPRGAVAFARIPVEADRTGKAVSRGGGQPGVTAAEAEADGEDRAGTRPEALDGGADIGLDSLPGRLRDVRRVLEVVAPLRRARRPTEVVDRDRVEAALGEAEGKFLVEAIEPPNVREDDDADPVRLVGVASKAAKRLPSAASSSMSLCETAAPAIRGTGGSESRSKHMGLSR